MKEHQEHCGCDCHGHEHETCGTTPQSPAATAPLTRGAKGAECGCGCHEHHEHETCGCGHDHHEQSGCGCGCGHDHDHGPEKGEGVVLAVGAALFALGVTAGFLHWELIQLLLLAAAYLVLGLPILKTAAKNILKGRLFDENFLMSIATLGALCIGEYAEAVGVMLFYRVGEYFEHKASAASRKNIMAAVDLRPETVTLENGAVIPAEDARVGDRLLVRPGDRIPLDGVVLAGESRVDTAPVTGESVPVGVKPGSKVISGCVNGPGLLTVEVEKPLSQSMVTRILESVEHAAASKPKMDRFITRFSRVYTPIVVGLAAATAILPSLVTGDWGYWVYTALSFLVMSCPCALVISVPLAFFSGIGVASGRGILFKGGAAMERLAGVKAAAMDKTGTLTKGEFVVLDTEGEGVLSLCALCEQNSTHPIAQSILAAAEPVGKCDSLEELPGLGIRARADGKQLLCGSRALMEQNGIQVPEMSGTVVYLAVDGAYRGWVRLGDRVKAESPAAVMRLKKQGVHPAMLTGDRAEAARQTAKDCGISDVFAGLLPQQKLEVLHALRKEHGPVLFVGDGINDAPVLAGADVGAAMGSGADAAIEAADVVFMTSRSDAIPEAVALARKTQRIAWQNVVFAIGIKAAVMVLGLLGYANMWLAVFADSGVAMLCVLNSIRLLRKRQ